MVRRSVEFREKPSWQKEQVADSAAKGEIFISYTVADRELADRLHQALESAGQAVWIDTDDIRYADNWKDAVFPAIERAPAILFVTSRASVSSENCLEELKYAELLGKRIIPIVAERVEELPDALKGRVRRDFRAAEGFDEELLRLIADITSDPEYVDTHTYLAYRAARWRADKTDLLGSKELRRADEWVAWAEAYPSLEPRPAELITDFIQVSRGSLRRRRTMTAALFLIIGLSIIGLYFGVQWWLGIPRSGVNVRLRDGDEAVQQRTADGVASLRQHLDTTIPDKRDRQRLLIATWNIRWLGRRPRPDESLHYIAEIISHFDIVAIQETMADPADFNRIRQILGRGWMSLESDLGANQERAVFLFDSRKITASGLIGELGLTEELEGIGRPYRNPYFVTFSFAGTDLAFCNVHLWWGDSGRRAIETRLIEVDAIAAELAQKVERGRDFPANLVLLGDVQGGSVGGQILEAIEGEGFLLPPEIRDLSSDVRGRRPYDQIALMLDPAAPLEVGAGGIVDFFQFVYTDDQADIYTSELEGLSGEDYHYQRSWLMSDHFPKWLELQVRDRAE